MASKVTCDDAAARWFDLVFCIGFLFLGVWFCIFNLSNAAHFMLMVYYFGFAGFMFLAWTQYKPLLMYCGFLKGYVTKSLLYLFCASLALADLGDLSCIIVGSIFAFMALVNLIRISACCAGDSQKV